MDLYRSLKLKISLILSIILYAERKTNTQADEKVSQVLEINSITSFLILSVLEPRDEDVGLTAPLSVFELNPEKELLLN